jgi:small GTP-binding protein
MSTLQKIAEIEAEMARTQKNKATAHHLGLLKAKLAKLKREIIAPSKGGGGGKPGEGFDVTKSGDARVGLIGFPSVGELARNTASDRPRLARGAADVGPRRRRRRAGKSTLLTKLTGTFSEVASYEFTTLTCIPGTFKYKGAPRAALRLASVASHAPARRPPRAGCQIQLLDLPGIIEGAKDGKGRGRQVIGVARTCNLILIVLDAGKPMTHKRIIEKELEGFGIRLNKSPPNITVKKKDKGGVAIINLAGELKHLDERLITSICREYRISNCEVTIRSDATVDELIDVIEGNRVYVPCIYVLNKIDTITIEELDLLSRVPHYVPVCAGLEWNFDELLEKVWTYLDMVRIYTKPKGQIPDYDSPVVLPRNKTTVEDFCLRIHKSLVQQFKYAWVWGSSVKHNPQKVGIDHRLNDEDVVQIVKKI